MLRSRHAKLPSIASRRRERARMAGGSATMAVGQAISHRSNRQAHDLQDWHLTPESRHKNRIGGKDFRRTRGVGATASSRR